MDFRFYCIHSITAHGSNQSDWKTSWIWSVFGEELKVAGRKDFVKFVWILYSPRLSERSSWKLHEVDSSWIKNCFSFYFIFDWLIQNCRKTSWDRYVRAKSRMVFQFISTAPSLWPWTVRLKMVKFGKSFLQAS